MPRIPRRFAALRAASIAALLFACLTAGASAQVKIDSATFGGLEARSIGPAAMSGRIAAMDGVASNPRTIYVGAAGGGLWKTVNAGVTFKPVFDKHTQSIGAITVDQRKPETVWVGTGEPWVRNSTSVGNGVYKTTDGGETWQLMGLEKSERIARIIVDPKDSDTVYVAALGPLWGGGGERGLYKTTDGGKTWERILFVNDDTGCSDIAIDPQESNVLYAGMWQFRRRPWTFTSGGPGSGLHRSTDGGKTWEKQASGFVEGELGRIAVAVAPSRASVVYASVEGKKTAIYRSDDMGKTWAQVNSSAGVGARPFYFSLLLVDPKDYNKIYKPGFSLLMSRDGGKSFSTISGTTHSDEHAMWIDPNDTANLYLGTDGGVYKSPDNGASWVFLRNLPVSQFYHVAVDMERPYNVYGGLQDNGSWMAPVHSPNGIENRDWRNVGYGDGFYTLPDPTDGNILYSEYQGGRLLRFHKRTGEIKAIAPSPKAGEPKYRFNWNAPVALSPHEPGTLYIGAQFLFRSRDKGESWERISPDLTTNDPEKQKQEESGGLTVDNSTAENHTTIYTVSESPLAKGVIWAGTDDGYVQLTRDGGKTWTNVVANVPALPKNTSVSSIEASRHDAATAYATFDGHMLGDMNTYVYKTADYGKTWKPIATEAVKGYAHIIREDLVKPDLLFVGTEFGLFLTVDGGRQWAQFKGNRFPNVAVRDIAIHPREHDVVLATHGRGVYIIDDITPVRRLAPQVLESKLAILEARPSVIRLGVVEQTFPGNDEFIGSNLPEVAYITYYLKERHVFGDFKLQIYDAANNLITTLPAGKRRGINRVEWPMRLKPPKVPTANTLEFGSLVGPVVPEGTYTVKFIKGDETFASQVNLVGDESLAHTAEDRKLQQQTVMNLYRMLERLAFVAESVKDARAQALARREGLKETDALSKSLAAFAARLDALHKTLVAYKEGQITGEKRLREEIGELYGEVSSFGGRPTRSQVDRAAVLVEEIDRANREFESIMGGELESLNSALRAKKLEPVKRLTKEEYDKRQS